MYLWIRDITLQLTAELEMALRFAVLCAQSVFLTASLLMCVLNFASE